MVPATGFAERLASVLWCEHVNVSMRIGLFFGSSTGATAQAAKSIQARLREQTAWEVEILDVAEFYLDEMLDFDHLILGIPTWNHGQLQADWEEVIEEFDALDLSGKCVALFGLGDQRGYPQTFGDAVFFLADRVRTQGATLVGRWPADGYAFADSWALENGEFLGLLLDMDNQPELTDARIARWTSQLVRELAVRDLGNENRGMRPESDMGTGVDTGGKDDQSTQD